MSDMKRRNITEAKKFGDDNTGFRDAPTVDDAVIPPSAAIQLQQEILNPKP